MNKKKVLVHGIGQTNFLAPIYSAIKKYHADISVHISKPKKLAEGISWGEEEAFDKVVSDKSLIHLISLFSPFKVLGNKICLQVLLLTLAVSGPIRAFRLFVKFCGSYIRMNREYDNYLYYHIHYVNVQNILIVPFLARKSKLILSFWGSDLMRNSEMVNHLMVEMALGRANTITIQSIELREMLLVKYGRRHFGKIKIIKFILDKRIFESIDRAIVTSTTSAFINKGKINVLVGHNAKRENNHKAIIEALSKLPKKIKASLYLIFVFGYGIKDIQFREYYEGELKELLQRLEIDFVFLNDFLDFEEVASLRLSADIALHFPISDALSSAVTESLYAGSVVVTGGWLPYGTMRRAGIRFFELERVEDLAMAMPEIVNNLKDVRTGLEFNRRSVADTFLSAEIEKAWAILYED